MRASPSVGADAPSIGVSIAVLVTPGNARCGVPAVGPARRSAVQHTGGVPVPVGSAGAIGAPVPAAPSAASTATTPGEPGSSASCIAQLLRSGRRR